MLPAPKPGGRPRNLDMRQVVNVILYLVVGGILPREYPKWQSVYHYFREWRNSGLWKRIHDILRARVREKAERHKHPSARCIDSQSVETTLFPRVIIIECFLHAFLKIRDRRRNLKVLLSQVAEQVWEGFPCTGCSHFPGPPASA